MRRNAHQAEQRPAGGLRAARRTWEKSPASISVLCAKQERQANVFDEVTLRISFHFFEANPRARSSPDHSMEGMRGESHHWPRRGILIAAIGPIAFPFLDFQLVD